MTTPSRQYGNPMLLVFWMTTIASIAVLIRTGVAALNGDWTGVAYGLVLYVAMSFLILWFFVITKSDS